MKNHFQHININKDQHQAIDKINDFLKSDSNIFILKGYAGTGKTTLIKGILKYLKSCEKQYSVMAPTGRAAKVLRDKTGAGRTIHSSIYKLQDLESINPESQELAEHSVKYRFPINFDIKEERVLIIDEASMISSKESKNELFDFGTNFLLNDLLSHTFQSNKSNKIIFVGDTAQLPPVGDNQSKALESTYFRELGYSCSSTELTEVMRQDNNLILKNATTIRGLLNEPKSHRNTIELDFDTDSYVKSDSSGVVDNFTNLYPNPEIGDGVIISYSNAQSYQYNLAIRKQLFPNSKDIVEGDIVMITNNNQYSYDTELFNGDLAKVVYVSDVLESQSAKVFTEKNKEKGGEIIKLNFREIKFRVPHYDGEVSCLIIDDLLNSIDRDLTLDMSKMLYINFVMRFNAIQKQREESGHRKHKVGSLEFKEELKKDPYYNALRVKYGYAITCHKAQGGEWDKVFVDYSGRTGLSDDVLKWSYTATSRGINTVYAINPPHLTSFSKLKFSKIVSVGKIPQNALFLDNINISPFHNESLHKAKSLKYWEVIEKLESTNFSIKNIESKEYLEKYTLCNNLKQEFTLEASHKGSGHFINQFSVSNKKGLEVENEIEKLFNENYTTELGLIYKPSTEFLESLYFMMRECCQELEISITNIDEQIDKYFVQYSLATDSIYSSVLFYFKANGNFSTAMPKTFNCENDKKLQLLIEKLENYAS